MHAGVQISSVDGLNVSCDRYTRRDSYHGRLRALEKHQVKIRAKNVVMFNHVTQSRRNEANTGAGFPFCRHYTITLHFLDYSYCLTMFKSENNPC